MSIVSVSVNAGSIISVSAIVSVTEISLQESESLSVKDLHSTAEPRNQLTSS